MDAGDSHAVYFPVASGAGGWLPIGDAANPFVAVFDGHGYAISNLAIRRDQIYIGLFAVIGEGAAIRDLGLSGNLAQQTGPAPGAGFSAVGGLVGWQEGGSITESYATGDAAGGGGNFDNVGGLVGRLQAGTIRASHATGAVAGGGGGFDHVGGLVGYAGGGSIVESHATGDAAGGGGDRNSVGGLVGFAEGVSITASHAKGYAVGGDGRSNYVGGLVGWLDRGGSILASYATGEAAGGDGALDRVGGLVGRQFRSLILASYATGDAAGGGGKDLVGGLVGLQEGLGAVSGERCGSEIREVACEILCGPELEPPPPFDPENPRSEPYCEAECHTRRLSYCGSAGGRPGSPREPSMIVASYATGTAFGGDGNDLVGGLVGRSRQSDIVASYALGDADGGIGKDHVGELVGLSENFRLSHGARVIIEPIDSYGFGHAVRGEMPGSAGPSRPIGVSNAFDLSDDNVGELAWNEARSNTLSVWDFGTDRQIPALRYADYDGPGNSFINCGPDPGDIPDNLCGTLLPGQVGVNATGPPAPLVKAGEVVTLSGSFEFGRVRGEALNWSWRQLEGPLVKFSNANARETTFTAPATSTRLVFELTATDGDGQEYSDRIVIPVFAEAVDRDGDGLIEIDSLAELHNMRHNLAGTSYKASANAAGNSLGCPGLICDGL